MQPKISIIIPVYNVEEYIEEAMYSIINQTIGLEKIEVIMVNDGSTDNSGKIIDKYANKYENFTAIHLEKASGAAGKPRNVGMEAANGKYIMFLDPDDLYEINACETLYNMAEKYDSDIVVGTYEQFNSKKRWKQYIFETKLTKELINVKIEESPDLIIAPPAIWSKIYRTDLIRKHKITFPEGVAGQDAVFAAETFFLAKKISFTPKSVYKYRCREDVENLSISQNLNLKFFEDFSETRRMIIDLYEKNKKLNYFETRYIPDLNYLLNKIKEAKNLSYNNKLKIIDTVYWFFVQAEKRDKYPSELTKVNLINLINSKKYEEAIELLDKQESLFYKLTNKLKILFKKIKIKNAPKKVKHNIKIFLIKNIGYGKLYLIIQNIYQRLKNIYTFLLYKNQIDRILIKLSKFFSVIFLLNKYCSKCEIKDLARRISEPIIKGDNPLVSIIVFDKNTYKDLNCLLKNIKFNTLYNNYELIIISNKKHKKLKAYLNKLQIKNFKLVNCKEKLNYSKCMNAGVKYSSGEYLAFLTSDVIPLYGWLSELIKTFQKDIECGVVGARLIYNKPFINKETNNLKNYPECSIAHDGIKFNIKKKGITSSVIGKYKHPIHDDYFKIYEIELPAILGTCMLTHKNIFKKANGFSEEYTQIGQDVDYCLKVKSINKKVILNKRSLLFYNESSLKFAKNDREAFMNNWGSELIKKVWYEKLENKKMFWSQYPLHVGFLVTEYSYYTTAGDLFSAKGLGEELKNKYGYTISYFPRQPICEWYQIPDTIDILISMRHDFDIRKSQISARTLKIAWIRGYIDEWLNKPWINHYDGIITTSKIALDKAVKILGKEKCWGIVPLGVSSQFLNNSVELKRDIDICFVGNIFDVPREIVDSLDLNQGFNFHFYGRLEGIENHPWKAYHKGTVYNQDLPQIYKRSKIVIDDTAPFNKGTVNLRIFEAAACGALVITNETLGIEELFENNVITYKDKNDLTQKIKCYLNNEKKRKKQAEKLENLVLNQHTFFHRAEEFKNIISSVVLKQNTREE